MPQQDFFTFQERNFDAFCKKIINNLSAYALRKSINTLKRNQTMDDSIIQEIASAQVEDDYHVYGRTLQSGAYLSSSVTRKWVNVCSSFPRTNERSCC